MIDVILSEALCGTPHIPSLSITRDGSGAPSLSTCALSLLCDVAVPLPLQRARRLLPLHHAWRRSEREAGYRLDLAA
jgi:hypothetical protein